MKKLCSLILGICIIMSAVVCMPMSASAYSPVSTKFYDLDTNDVVGDGGGLVTFPADGTNKVSKIAKGAYFQSDAGEYNFFTTEFDFYAYNSEQTNDKVTAGSVRLQMSNSSIESQKRWYTGSWGSGFSLSQANMQYNKWYTLKIAADKFANKIIFSCAEKGGEYSVIKVDKLYDESYYQVGNKDNNYKFPEGVKYTDYKFSVVQFINIGDSNTYYIDNISNKLYKKSNDNLMNESTADSVKDALEFFGYNGFITLDSSLTDDVANKVYESLAGKTYETTNDVQTAYDAAIVKYSKDYYVEFKDTKALKDRDNTFTVNFANNTSDAANVVLVNAIYSADKTLLGVELSDSIVVDAGDEKELTAAGSVNADAASVKQIVINSIDNLTPYSLSNTLTVE